MYQYRRFVYLFFVIASLVSSFGSAMTSFALDVQLFRETGSYSSFAMLSVWIMAASVASGLFAGYIVDFFPKRFSLIGCQLLGCATVCAIALKGANGVLSIQTIYVSAILLSVISGVYWTASSATMPGLMTADDLKRCNGIIEAFAGARRIAAPLAGAAALEFLGVRGVAICDSASYIACAFCIGTLRLSSQKRKIKSVEMSAKGLLLQKSFITGAQWILANPRMTRLLSFFVLFNIGNSIFLALYTPYILSLHHAGALSICLSSGGGGMIFGGTLLGILSKKWQNERAIYSAACTMALMMVLWGISHPVFVLSMMAFVYGAANSVLNATSQSIWQSVVPPDLQGRVFSVRRTIAWFLNPISVLVSIPFVLLFLGPVTLTLQSWAPSANLWGTGQTGAIGLCMSLCGLLCALVVTAAFRLSMRRGRALQAKENAML